MSTDTVSGWLLFVFAALVVAVVLLWWIGATRRLRGLRQDLHQRFGDYLDGLSQRLLLTEALAAHAAQLMRHERTTVNHLVQARVSTLIAAEGAARAVGEHMPMHTLAVAERHLVEALKKLTALVEAYPDLKDDVELQSLITALRDGRTPLAASRQSFDMAVLAYNAAIARNPATVIAIVLRLHPLTPLTPQTPLTSMTTALPGSAEAS